MKPKHSVSGLLYLLLGAGAIAFVTVLLYYRYQFDGPASSEPAAWGQFGDFFGGTLNPVFAYLTFTALVVTLALQTKHLEVSVRQLEQSQEELAATRIELQRSADAQAATAEALSRQAVMAALSAKVSAVSKALDFADAQITKWGNPDPANSRYAFYKQLLATHRELEAEFNKVLEDVRNSAA